MRLRLFALFALCCALRIMAQPEMAPVELADEQDIDRLVLVLADQGLPDATRTDAAKRLAVINAPATEGALTRALSDPQPAVRKFAATALGLIADPQASPALITAVGDTNAEVRVAAATALGRLRDTASAAALGRAALDSDATVRTAAVTALNFIPGDDARDALRVAVDDGNDDIVPLALYALGRRGDRAITPLCLARLAGAGPVNPLIVEALGELGDPAAADTLFALLSDPQQSVRLAAMVGLTRTGDTAITGRVLEFIDARDADFNSINEEYAVWVPALSELPHDVAMQCLTPWLQQPQKASARIAVEVLCPFYDSPTEYCPQLLRSHDGNTTFKTEDWLDMRQPADMAQQLYTMHYSYADYCLAGERSWRDSDLRDGLLGPEAPPITFDVPTPSRSSWFMTPDFETRLIRDLDIMDGLQGDRVERLGHSGDPNICAPLFQAMLAVKPEDFPVVQACGTGLGALADPDAIPDLLKLADDKEAQVRDGVDEGLDGCADPRDTTTYDLLLQRASDPNPDIGNACVAALGCARDARAVPLLLDLMAKNDRTYARGYCAQALGLIGDSRAVPALVTLLNDGEEWEREAAAWALGEIGDPQAIPALHDARATEHSSAMQARIAWALYQLGEKDNVVTLAKLMLSTDWDTRDQAYHALLECDGEGTTGPLLARLAEKPDYEVLKALGHQRSEQAVPMLLDVLDGTDLTGTDGELRRWAAWSLGCIGAGKDAGVLFGAADALYHTAISDPTPNVRAEASCALAHLHDGRAADAIARAMNECVSERNACYRALWDVDGDKATALLVAGLQDDDPLGRSLAAHGLCLRGDPRGKAMLKDLLTNETERATVQASLKFAGELKDPDLAPAIIRYATASPKTATMFIVIEAIKALAGNPAPEATKTLVGLLGSPASPIREAAAQSLASTTDPAARAALDALKAKEDSTRVLAAIDAQP